MRAYVGAVVGMFGVFTVVACDGFGSSSEPDPAPAAPPGTTPITDLPPGAAPPLVGSPSVDELTEKFGVFVATTGSADGDGTRAKPFATIAAGIDRVKDLKLRVYVCSGIYKESITLASGVSVVGGLGCTGGTWSTGAARTRIESPTSPAVRARDIVFTTRFESFDVVVPAGTAAAPSSIAFIAERSPKLAIVSTKLAAAKGFDGADGVDVAPLTLGAAAKGTDGLSYVGEQLTPAVARRPGQAGGIGSCGGAGHDGESGSTGGNGVTQICKQFASVPAPLFQWEVYVNSVGVAYDRSNAAALSSAAGTAGPDGDSARSLGALSADGYVPSNGTAGTDGSPGKGGSGGNGGAAITGNACTAGEAGYVIYGPSGPGGGAGGCPGLAGTAGGGGGASIAALVFASAGLTFTTSELVAADGGKGGMGAFGTAPTAGGQPGIPKNGAPAGAAGGAGGRAGWSGNGTGGPSMALAYTGGDPVVASDTQTTAGLGGKGVIERSGGGVTIPASSDGPSKALFAF